MHFISDEIRDLNIMINTDFIFQTELNKGRPQESWLDADAYSKELQEAHRILWSKPLPNGKMFNLKKTARNRLVHTSDMGIFILASDRAVPAFFNKAGWQKRYPYLTELSNEETQSFLNLSETIGGMAIWPAQKNGGMTINQAKGYHPRIADRLDLTLECIRRHYAGMNSPLAETIKRYDAFFALFGTFKNYIDFFIFHDWVDEKYETVKIAPPYDAFNSSPVPKTLFAYLDHRLYVMELIRKRNKRIDKEYNTSNKTTLVPLMSKENLIES